MSTDQVDDLMRSDGPTVLQTPPRKAVTSANAAGALGLRMYLKHDESRHHRVSGLSHRSTNAPPVLHRPELGGHEVPVATGLATLSVWEVGGAARPPPADWL